jgi:two-component system CheB/CheR fusion protein
VNKTLQDDLQKVAIAKLPVTGSEGIVTKARERQRAAAAHELSAARFVVGIGASAGGLEALERFFDKAPTDSGGAFVVVMHLARNFRSVLDELLSRHTQMPVRPIVDGVALEPDTVYVIQPGTEIEIVGPRFRVTSRPSSPLTGRLSSIDVMLRSIATSWGARAVGVVLSGSGTDGAQGVVAIHAAGGATLVQSPESAKFDSMPIAAIATNCVAAIDTAELLGRLACESVSMPRLERGAARSPSDVDAFQAILAAAVGSSHLDPAQYTQSTFERRVFRRMVERRVGALSDYAELVRSDSSEARALSETLLIGVTDFFRDESAFVSLARLVAPELVRRAHRENRPIRVWAPGCASGEEAYSIAMILAEATADYPTPVEFQVFASDVHKGLLAEAARGEYPTERVINVSESRLRDFFVRSSNGSWQVAPRLRKSVIFAPHDVLVDPPFTRLDLISCRNLLIYFSVEAQQRVLASFAFGLLEDGYLFLGGSETVGAQREAFEFVDVRRRIFRRTRARARGSLSVRTPEASDRNLLDAAIPTIRRSQRLRETYLQPVYATLLKEFAPPSLLVSADRDLLHTFGDARKYLRAPEGLVRLDITDMCDPALKTPIAAGIDRAMRDRVQLTFSRVELQSFPEPGKLVDVTIRPLDRVDAPSFALVMLADSDSRLPSAPVESAMATDRRSAELEVEILRTREALQATIEEIEATNEQLKAANEELLSSNEELQSTNEELSSLNEELHSVNAEHFRQNTEMVRLTRDFDALLRVSEIGVLFLDDDYCIQRFTRLVAELFQFADGDIGRALRTFRSPFVDFDLERFLGRVMRGGVSEGAEVQDETSRTWLLRGARYPDQKGVVLSIISVGVASHVLSGVAQDRSRVFANAAPFAGDALIVADPDTGVVLFANARALMIYGVPESPHETFEISRITPEWGTAMWIKWLSSINVGASGERSEVTVIDRKGDLTTVDLRATVLREQDRRRAVVRIIESVAQTASALAIRELNERTRSFAVSNRELERFASVVAHDLRAPLRHLSQFSDFLEMEVGAWANDKAREYLGIIKSSADRLTNMVDRLLDYARIGVGAPRMVPVDLAACLQEARELLRADAGDAAIEVRFGKFGWARGDRVLVTRLFQNLLQNAAKFRRPEAAPQIVVSAVGEGKFVVVSVEDNGVGVDPSQAEKIFEMFGRAHSDRDFEGHGIGLAFCKRICEALGGSISLDAAKQDGARFLVRLARARPKRGKSSGA